jgi:hypothetical protein
MNSGSPPGDEFSNRRVSALGLEQLYQGLARLESLDPRAIGIVDVDALQSQNVAKKRKRGVKRFQSDSNVSDANAVGG